MKPAAEMPTETGCEVVVRVSLPNQDTQLFVPVLYRSATGRHLFDWPGAYQIGAGNVLPLTFSTLVLLVVNELSEAHEDVNAGHDLTLAIAESCENIARFIEERGDESLYGFDAEFTPAEQSVIFGHLFHPTPKSRPEIGRLESGRFDPELGESFQLAYFRADEDIVAQGSFGSESAVRRIKSALRADPNISGSFVRSHVDSADALIPVHPWQATHLLEQPHVEELQNDGVLEYLGQRGRLFAPTTSVRTVYHPDVPFMVKSSLAVEITNSVRTNKAADLDRGVLVSALLDNHLEHELDDKFPAFEIIRDSAYVTVEVEGKSESGFEVILRENPFKRGDHSGNVPVVSLCQDAVTADASRLRYLIDRIATDEGRSVREVSVDWFRRYLELLVEPILWLFLTHGVAPEPHQQNCVLSLADCYPDRLYCRDNQGVYFAESEVDALESAVPGISRQVKTVFSDTKADQRLCYQLIVNNVFGVVNAFGMAGLVSEMKLLEELRHTVSNKIPWQRPTSNLVADLLSAPTLPCKANLLTRSHAIDESDEMESVYVDINNPLS